MGKILLLSFEDNEDEIISSVLSVLQTGRTYCRLEETKFKSEIQYRDILISFVTREVIRHNKKIDLTFTEFEILKLLVQNSGKVFSKEQIYDRVWKEPYSSDYNIVMSHIRNIREKIEDDPSKPVFIQTVWGVGYRFNENISSSL